MVSKKKSDEFSLDITGVTSFFKKLPNSKHSKVYFSIFLIAIAIFASIFFRAYSYDLPITDDWAYNNIYNSIRSQVAGQINQQYPNF